MDNFISPHHFLTYHLQNVSLQDMPWKLKLAVILLTVFTVLVNSFNNFQKTTDAKKISKCFQFKQQIQQIPSEYVSYVSLVASAANSAADIGFCWTLYSWYRPLLPFTICLIGAGIVAATLSYPALRGIHSFGGITYNMNRKVQWQVISEQYHWLFTMQRIRGIILYALYKFATYLLTYLQFKMD